MSTKTLVLHPYLKSERAAARTPEARLEEAVSLAYAIDLNVQLAETVPLAQRRSATLLGKGKIEEMAELIHEYGIGLVIVNHTLSPGQQKNLEKEWNTKVIDRTALILEIFGARAATAEGKLQVELAALEYQKGRLVRSWTHLERQRGGFGFLGGPGETQIETDRRLLRDRISAIKEELGVVTRTRDLARKSRERVPYPVVALVGYTNAGKSTLFNALTGAGVVAKDQLFATLDPTLRRIKLPGGSPAILSDTVGFVSDLPHELVAAFRATLEEVLSADVLLHVRDISHPESAAQKQDVETVLEEIFDNEERWRSRLVEVWNKADLLPKDISPPHGICLTSALKGTGLDVLLAMLDGSLTLHYETLELELPAGEGKALAWLHANGEVVKEELVQDAEMLSLIVRLSPENAMRFRKKLERSKA